jgi:hypothetical protein
MAWFFNRKKELSQNEKENILSSIKMEYQNSIEEIVQYLLSGGILSISPDIKNVSTGFLKFETTLFILFRLDYFVIQIKVHPKVREWLNTTFDNYIKTLVAYNANSINQRLNRYSDNLRFISDGSDFYRNFSEVSYNTFFGFIKRAINKTDWSDLLELKGNEILPVGGLSVLTDSLSIEENIILPTFKAIQESLKILELV